MTHWAKKIESVLCLIIQIYVTCVLNNSCVICVYNGEGNVAG